MEKKTLELFELGIKAVFPQAQVEIQEEAENIAVRLYEQYYGNIMTTLEFQIPANWWQHLLRSIGFKKIKYETIKIDVKEYYSKMMFPNQGNIYLEVKREQ